MMKGLLIGLAGVVLVTSVLLISLNSKKLPTNSTSNPMPTNSSDSGLETADVTGTIVLSESTNSGTYDVWLELPGADISAMALRLVGPTTMPQPSIEHSGNLTTDDWSFPVEEVTLEDSQYYMDLALVNLTTEGFQINEIAKIATLDFGESVDISMVSFDKETTQLILKSGQIVPLKIEYR